MEERLVKIARLLATASIISHVITSLVAVLTIYAHLAGRAIAAAKVVFFLSSYIEITEIIDKFA